MRRSKTAERLILRVVLTAHADARLTVTVDGTVAYDGTDVAHGFSVFDRHVAAMTKPVITARRPTRRRARARH